MSRHRGLGVGRALGRAVRLALLGGLLGLVGWAGPAAAQPKTREEQQAEAEAIRAIGRRTSDRDLEILLRRSDNKYIRAISARWLGERNYRAGQHSLFAAIDDPAVYVQRSAAVAYARLCGCQFEARILELFRSARESTRFAGVGTCIEILDHCQGRSPAGMGIALRGVSWLVKDPSPLVRREAVVLLNRMPADVLAERRQNLLLTGLRDVDSKVRGEAVRGLNGATGPAVARALLPLLDDADPVVQRAAVRALVRTGDPLAIRAVRNLLGHRKPAMRIQGIRALVNLADPTVGSDLQLVLTDRVAEVRKEAIRGIARLQPPDAGPLLASGLRDHDVQVRLAAARALRDVCLSDDAATGRALAMAVRDQNREVAEEAFRAVSCTRNKDILPELIEALCNAPHMNVRQSLVRYLKTLTFANPGTRCLDWRKWWTTQASEGAAVDDGAEGD